MRKPKPEDIELGGRIRTLRLSLDGRPTQVAFAAPLGVERGSVVNWERGGGAKRDSLLKISAAYGVSFEWLATGNGPMYLDGTEPAEPPPDSIARRLLNLFSQVLAASPGTQFQAARLLEKTLTDAQLKSRATSTKHAS